MKETKVKNKKGEKGITLIALVVTIVVLLILAGVTITTVLGEGGIIDSARTAGEMTNETIKNEEQMLQNIADRADEYLNGGSGGEQPPVPENHPVTQITLNEKELTIEIGETRQITATVKPEEATDKSVTWNSSDVGVVTIENEKTATITVIGETEGTTKIKAIAQDGSKIESEECKVTVKQPIISKDIPFVGYYADIDGKPGITEDDGIIYADFAIGGSGEWGSYSSGKYEIIPKDKSKLKEYTVSKDKVKINEGFGEQYYLTATDVGEEERFLVMALKDIEDNQKYTWYTGALTLDSSKASTDFYKGKSNTKNMIGYCSDGNDR